jgi:NitT/TauT family transport system permease protein
MVRIQIHPFGTGYIQRTSSMKSTSPALVVNNNQPSFTWVDGLALLALFGVLWSLLHFGKGMLVAFDPSSVAPLDVSTV